MKTNKKNKILFIGSIDFPFNTANANFIRRLFESLFLNGREIEILLTKGAIDVNNQSNSKSKKFIFNGIKCKYCSFRNKQETFFLKFFEIFLGSLVSSLTLVKRIILNKVDLVIIYTGYPYFNLPIIFISRIFKIKMIKISVDWYTKEQVVTKSIYHLKWWLFHFEINYVDKLLQGIVVLNSKLRSHYKKIGFKDNSILLIPSIIDLEEFNVCNNLKSNDTIIGFCGAAPFLNGVDVLIYAFNLLLKEFQSIKLLIIGGSSGNDSDILALKNISNNLGISEHIEFAGRMPTHELVSRLAACEILTLPRKKNRFSESGFPTKLGEYFALKKAVVLSKVGDFPKYFIDKKEVVFCEPDNPQSLKEAISYLLINQYERKLIAEQGYNWAKSFIDKKLISKTFLSFIDKL